MLRLRRLKMGRCAGVQATVLLLEDNGAQEKLTVGVGVGVGRG